MTLERGKTERGGAKSVPMQKGYREDMIATPGDNGRETGACSIRYLVKHSL